MATRMEEDKLMRMKPSNTLVLVAGKIQYQVENTIKETKIPRKSYHERLCKATIKVTC